MTALTLTAPLVHARSAVLRLWLAMWRERDDLSRLDDHLLADIGVTPDEATRESLRAFWDVPPARR